MKAASVAAQRSYFLVFERGDDVLGTIRDFARQRGIRGGRFAAIGALQRGAIAFWNRERLEYERIEVEEQVEVASLIGDIAVEEGETRIHAHAVLGRRDGSSLAGHLLEGTVFPTLEMHLVDFGEPLERRRDPETGLSPIAIRERT